MKIVVVSKRISTSTQQNPVSGNAAADLADGTLPEEQLVAVAQKQAAQQQAKERAATYETLHKEASSSVLSSIQHNDWDNVAKTLIALKSSKSFPRTARGRVTKMINSAISIKEMFMIDDSEAVDNDKVMSAYEEAMNTILRASRDIAADVRSYEEVTAENESELFKEPDSKSAIQLRQSLMENDMAIGEAPIAFVLENTVNRKMLRDHFKIDFVGAASFVLHQQRVVGVTEKYARKHDFDTPGQCARELAETWAKKNGSRYQVLDQVARWQDAVWALCIAKTDLAILARAGGGGHFKPRGWGFGFKGARPF